MSDPWSERAQMYRDSKAHSEGADLDLVVEWAAGLESAIDVATGGGHVARRLREAGLQVVSCDPSPGHAAGRHLLRGGSAVRGRELRPTP